MIVRMYKGQDNAAHIAYRTDDRSGELPDSFICWMGEWHQLETGEPFGSPQTLLCSGQVWDEGGSL